MRLKEILNKNLIGFKISLVYYLELKHGLAGFFPAIYVNDPDEIVVCFSRELIERINNYNSAPTKESLSVLSEDQFKKLTQEGKKPFKWAPGLVG